MVKIRTDRCIGLNKGNNFDLESESIFLQFLLNLPQRFGICNNQEGVIDEAVNVASRHEGEKNFRIGIGTQRESAELLINKIVPFWILSRLLRRVESGEHPQSAGLQANWTHWSSWWGSRGLWSKDGGENLLQRLFLGGCHLRDRVDGGHLLRWLLSSCARDPWREFRGCERCGRRCGLGNVVRII
jgi:hypothetical protein